MKSRRRGRTAQSLAAFGCGLAALCLAQPAAAHRHTYYHPAHPYLSPASTELGPTYPGASTVLIDAASGQILSSNGADVPRYPASLTKLMTLDLAFQALQAGSLTLDTQIPVSEHATDVEPVKLGLFPGETLTVRQAILAMTTMSANDAATALGEYIGGGSEERCAEMMTQRARQLGMAQTQFYNASGLPNPGQITTARDLALLARDIVVNYPQEQQFFEVQEFDFNGHAVYSNNQMLKTYPGATGMKTGYTILAEHNLVTSAVRNGRVLIGVELHEPSWGTTYTQMTAMLDNGFEGGFDSPQAAAPVNMAQAAPPVAMAQAAPPVAMTQAAPPVAMAQAAPPPGVSYGDSAVHVTYGPPPAPPHSVSHMLLAQAPRWTAELGIFSRMSTARIEAINVKQMRGDGVARIARLETHGRIMWTAQLAGLTLSAAHNTCTLLEARGAACHVTGPFADHLAMAGDAASGA